MEMKNGDHILFLCDRKACGETCPNESCSHTGDIRHAKNFDSVEVNANGLVDFFEVESEPSEYALNEQFHFEPTGDTLKDISAVLEAKGVSFEDIPQSLINRVFFALAVDDKSDALDVLARFCDGYPVYESELNPYGSKYTGWLKSDVAEVF